MFLFFVNITAGNFEAWRERGISRVSIPEKIKKMLFPFFYVKRITYITLLYQIANVILFAAALVSLLLVKTDCQSTFQLYWNFEKYYIFCVPLFIEGRLKWIRSHELKKIRHYGENWGQELFGELNGEFYHINKNEVIVIRPANINGCVFMMLENIIQYGIDVCYKDILYKLLDMNYMHVCIDEYPAKNLKRYKIIMEETIRFFNVSGKPFFYMGVESDGMFVTLKMDHVFKSNGMIWLCERKRKKS